MSEKILEFFDFQSDTINYTTFIEKIRAKLTGKSHREQLRFCFILFDHDGNHMICPKDLDIFYKQYAGVCTLLSSDFIDLSRYLKDKRKNSLKFRQSNMSVPDSISPLVRRGTLSKKSMIMSGGPNSPARKASNNRESFCFSP